MPEIAMELSISPNTVRTHLDQARQRLGCEHIWEMHEPWEQIRGPWAFRLIQRMGIPLDEIVRAAGQDVDL